MRAKIAAALAACILLPVAAGGVALYAGGPETSRGAAQLQLQTHTRAAAQAAGERLASALADLKAWSTLATMQEIVLADSGGAVARTLASLKKQHSDFSTLTVTDTRGASVAASGPRRAGNAATGDEGWRTALSGRIHQGPATAPEKGQAATIRFTVPVIADYDGQTIAGTLSGIVDLRAIVQAVARREMPDGSALVVLGDDGRAVASLGANRRLVSALKELGGKDGEITWNGKPHLAARASVTRAGLAGDTGLTVYGVMPSESLMVATGKLSALAATVATIVALGALAAALFWTEILVRVGAAMNGLAHGDIFAHVPRLHEGHMFAPMTRALENFRHSRIVRDKLAQRERELERAKEDAEKALKAKSEHLASLARALKAQLSTIVELSEAINRETLGAAFDGARPSAARDISRAGVQLLNVIEDLFDLSEAEAGHLTLEESEFDLAALVRESAGLMQEAAARGKVELSCPDAAVLTVRADAQKMKQILFNLLSNAIKFTPEGGNIRVDVRLAGVGEAAVAVTDTGIGMDTSLSPFAAGAFAESETGHGKHGAGLGLPLVKQLTELQGGTATIESEAGKGTTVTVTLPACRVVQQNSAQEAV